MKKKLLIIIGASILAICLVIALYFTAIKMDYTVEENGYTTSYRGAGKGTFTIKVEREEPLNDCYFHVRNNNGDILEYKVKSKSDSKIVLKIKGLQAGDGSISLFVSENPNNLEVTTYSNSNLNSELESVEGLEEIETIDLIQTNEATTEEELDSELEVSEDIPLDEELISYEDENTDVTADDEEIEIILYSADMVFGVTSDLKLYLDNCGIESVKDPELIFEKGEFKLYGQNFNTVYRLIIPNAKKAVEIKTANFGIVEIANDITDDSGKRQAMVLGNRMGTEKILVSSPYDDVNVVLEFKSFKILSTETNYSISLTSFDGSEDVDLSVFYDGIDYTLMATTLDNLPISKRATIKEYSVMSKTYDEGTDICTINLIDNYKNISYVVSEKVTMDELLVDVTPMMESANIPLVEDTVNDINVKSYEYIDGDETYSLMFFAVGNDNCMLTSDEATVEELKHFVENIIVKDLSEYKGTVEN